VRAFFISLLFLIIACSTQEGPTGYKYGGGTTSYIVETCDEDEFLGQWFEFHTKNVIANTLVPSYKDYCTYIEEDYVFYWNQVEGYGYFDYDWEWYCANENTMKMINHATGDVVEMRIYGNLGPNCYDVKISYGSNSINGELCGCLYNGP